MKKLFNTLFLASLFSVGYAQQDPQFSMYFNNQLFFNPAAAGAEYNTQVVGQFRKQWTGFDGAPLTFSLAGDHYFKKIRSGIGVIGMYDAIGFQKTWNARLAYSFRIPIKKTFLQLGVDFGTITQELEGNFVPIQPGDPSIPTGKSSDTKFIFSAGVYFWSKRFSAGISAKNLNGPKLYLDNLNGEPLTVARHYYLYLQYRQPLGKYFTLRPTFLVKSDAASTQLDASLLFYYLDWCYFGTSYRIDDAIVLTTGGKAGIIWLQYAYDITTSKLNGYSNGTHEVMIRYTIPYKEE